jgi:PAS domain-containing protein
VENLETGILLADDQMEPVFVSRRARQLLDSKPEGADDARIAGLLQDEDFSELLKEVLSTQARCEPRFVDLEVGASEPRRLRLWVEPVLSPTGDVREMILLIRKAG